MSLNRFDFLTISVRPWAFSPSVDKYAFFQTYAQAKAEEAGSYPDGFSFVQNLECVMFVHT